MLGERISGKTFYLKREITLGLFHTRFLVAKTHLRNFERQMIFGFILFIRTIELIICASYDAVSTFQPIHSTFFF